MRLIGFLLGMLLIVVVPVVAQDESPNTTAYTVFLQRGIDATGLDRLTFINTQTGAQIDIDTYGERYTPAGDAILFYNWATNRVILATRDGNLSEHPFIQPNIETQRVDWVVSDDQTRIAWTLTNVDSVGRLTTVTTVANLDGTGQREVLVDGPSDEGFRALPLAFSVDNAILYMDMHLDGLNSRMPITQYVQLFALDLESGETTLLPAEESSVCICGADVSDGMFVRLALADDQNGFDVNVFNLQGEIGNTIDSLNLDNYIHAGDLLISNDGRYAVYALVQIDNFGTPQQATRTVFVLADLVTLSQQALTQPISTQIRPLEWTEDDTAILFTSVNRDGTWKVELDNGRLERIADATYLGTLR